jgi:hypothetical protein
VKLRSSHIRYTTPDHDATTAKSVPLDNTTVNTSFLSPTVNTTTTICSKEIKPWFLCEENRLPTLSPPNSGIMAPQPLHACKSSARSKWISNMWTICPDTKFSESIAHSLSTYTWLCVPCVVMAVSTAVRVWLRRCVSLIRRPCLAIVTRRRPLRGRSLVFPNSTRRPCRRWTVVWWTPRAVATSCSVVHWRSIVTARLRSSLLKRGITGDISHEWGNHVFCVYPSWP